MKSIFKKMVPLMLAFVMCIVSVAIPAHAAGTINISGGANGITITPGAAPDMTDVSNAYDTVGDTVISKGKTVAQTITAVCTIICFVALFISITKLSTSGSHPMQRRMAIMGILWSGVAITLFGGGWVVVSFFWNFLSH